MLRPKIKRREIVESFKLDRRIMMMILRDTKVEIDPNTIGAATGIIEDAFGMAILWLNVCSFCEIYWGWWFLFSATGSGGNLAGMHRPDKQF